MAKYKTAIVTAEHILESRRTAVHSFIHSFISFIQVLTNLLDIELVIK
jgi:hypothetical protein